MLDTGYWMLDTGCSMPDTGYPMLDTRYEPERIPHQSIRKLMTIRLTERSDIYNYSIFSFQLSMPACPGGDSGYGYR
ncbi:hypothetical protein D1BOALGB6SA_2018 [Olavius sp. associated proteobacterium Delta 1]|nr:hypothetical protein D1BOALGB6SA_2018 [Olavius sp. associated proteobacterium Delta 1]